MTDEELIRLYVCRKAVRRALLETHHTVYDHSRGGPMLRGLDLSEEAVKRRAALWPVLDDLNARIRVIPKPPPPEHDKPQLPRGCRRAAIHAGGSGPRRS